MTKTGKVKSKAAGAKCGDELLKGNILPPTHQNTRNETSNCAHMHVAKQQNRSEK